MPSNGSYIDGSTFFPVPELEITDGAVVILFLIPNGVQFLSPTDDPWYRVPKTKVKNETVNGWIPVYRPTEAASPLGCVERYQFCRSESECGPLAAFFDARREAARLFDINPAGTGSDDAGVVESMSTRKALRYLWFLDILMAAGLENTIPTVVRSQQSAPLRSTQTLSMGMQVPLPPDQWIQDITHWWHTWLANLQLTFVSTATGIRYNDTDESMIRVPPDGDAQRDMCNNQVSLFF